MREHINLIEMASDRTEQFWVNTANGEIEMVYDHDEYGPLRDALDDGYVAGDYHNATNTFSLQAKDARSLSLALRAILTNHSSAEGCHYRLVDGEEGTLDYVEMMGLRNTGALPPQRLAA